MVVNGGVKTGLVEEEAMVLEGVFCVLGGCGFFKGMVCCLGRSI